MTELLEPDEGEFTELAGAIIPRLDLVGKGANGMPFLIAKADEAGASHTGVFDAGFVRDLIAKSEPEPDVAGATAALMKAIHEAALRAPSTTSEGGSMKDDVSKADVPEGDEPLPDADEVAGSTETVVVDGDPDDPTSPAWEAVDAARAQQAVDLTTALRRMVVGAQDREMQEAAVGADGDDAGNAFALDDVLCALDCILGVLAPFAVTEQAEAEERQADLDALTKGQVRKAGRVLSSANEQAIRDASASLERVLASLPAPVTDDEPVAKSETKEADVASSASTMTVTVEVDAESLEKAKAELADVAKAKGDPVVAVYDATGNLVGTIDPGDLQPIAAPTPPDGGDAQGDDAAAPADDAADAAPAATDEDAAAPVADDAAPAPAADAAPDAAQIPGTDTVAAPAPTADDDDTVTKATQAAVSAALTEVLGPITERLSQHAELSDLVKGLQERVEHLAAMPDDRKSPLMNGATGVPGLVSRDGAEIDPLQDLKKAVAEATTPETRLAAENALAYTAIRDRFKPITG